MPAVLNGLAGFFIATTTFAIVPLTLLYGIETTAAGGTAPSGALEKTAQNSLTGGA